MSNVTSFSGKQVSPPEAPRSPGVTKIYLLGMMRAIGPKGENLLPRAKKTQAVLACLCLARGERLLRNRLAGLIWDRSGEAQAKDSLRHALSDLERTGRWSIETDQDTVRLDVTHCWIDAFETPQASDLLLDSLYGISSAFDQWLVGERSRFEARWQEKLEAELADLVRIAAGSELRAAAARKLLNLVPTHEVAVRSLLTAFVDMGDRSQAIREYERFRVVISNNLGMQPSEPTVALYEAIRAGSRARVTPARDRNAGVIGGTTSGPGQSLQPSVAVLPFQNLSAQAGDDHLAEGLAEDLFEALSRIPSLFVVSRLSAAIFKHQDRPPAEIGEALGVRYLLSGSLRKAGDQLRLVAELTEAPTGAVLWVSRLDETCEDLLDLQNRLAERVVRHVAPHLRSAEIKRVQRKRPEHQDGYDLLLRAQESMHSPSRTVFETAGELFQRAIERDPHFAQALAWRAHWHVMRVGQGWSPDPVGDTGQADYFADRAIECDATEPLAFAVRGHVAAYLRKDFDHARACFDKAVQINPNGPRAWLWNAAVHAWVGEGRPAIEKINRAMSLAALRSADLCVQRYRQHGVPCRCPVHARYRVCVTLHAGKPELYDGVQGVDLWFGVERTGDRSSGTRASTPSTAAGL